MAHDQWGGVPGLWRGREPIPCARREPCRDAHRKKHVRNAAHRRRAAEKRESTPRSPVCVGERALTRTLSRTHHRFSIS